MNKILVSNFSQATNIADLAELFAEVGELVALTMHEGEFGAFAIVEMGWAVNAEQAVAQFNDHNLDGQNLQVKLAKW